MFAAHYMDSVTERFSFIKSCGIIVVIARGGTEHEEERISFPRETV